jgi:integrating conjugative element protein (TIGR03765 family)
MKKKALILFLFLFFWILSGAELMAEPIVIRDHGGQDSGVPDKAAIAKQVMGMPIAPVNPKMLNAFPLTSSLRSGTLEKSQPLTNKPLTQQAFFIVGNELRSREWIADNKKYLIKLKAQGLVTNITNDSEFQALVRFAEPLTLNAIPLDEIAESLGLSVYPVLITQEAIAQ